MGRTPLLTLLFALTMTFTMISWTPVQADDGATNLEASAIKVTFDVTEESTPGSATTTISNVADPFDAFFILTLTIGIIGLISVRRHVKS